MVYCLAQYRSTPHEVFPSHCPARIVGAWLRHLGSGAIHPTECRRHRYRPRREEIPGPCRGRELRRQSSAARAVRRSDPAGMGGATQERRLPSRGLHSRERLPRLRRRGGDEVAPGARQAREVAGGLSGRRQNPSARAARGRRGTPRAHGRRRFVRGPACAGRNGQRRDLGVAGRPGQGTAAEKQRVPPLPQYRRPHGSGRGRKRGGADRRDFDRPLRAAEEAR